MKKISVLVIFILGIFNFVPMYASASDEGCTPAGPYSTITGKLCVTGPITMCPEGDKYSRVTGKLCNFWQGAASNGKTLPLVFATKKIPNNIRFGEKYSTDMFATGGTGQYTWTVSSGSLPPGLELNQYGPVVCIKAPCVSNPRAVISGRATRSGVYGFTLKVVSGLQQATRSFSIVVTNT